MQGVAMIRHMYEIQRLVEQKKDAKGKESKDINILYGLPNATGGLVEQVPLMGGPIRAYTALESYDTASDYLKNMIPYPQFLKEWAKHQDTYGDNVVPRETDTVGKFLKASTPGQRKNLPVDIAKVKKMQLDQLAEIMENAPGDVVDQIQPVFRSKLSDEDRNRYLELIK
jgi:pyruvate carboxylase